jgi:hypothetical protein
MGLGDSTDRLRFAPALARSDRLAADQREMKFSTSRFGMDDIIGICQQTGSTNHFYP